MAAVKGFDPLDVAAVVQWVAQTSKLRLLALQPGKGNHRGKLWAYAVTKPDAALEFDLAEKGCTLVGYYTRKAEPAQVMADIAAAMI
jgi:hypothetical protein